MRKRLIALLLTLAMAFTTMSPVGSLAENAGSDIGLTLEVSSASVKRGDTVTVTVNATKTEEAEIHGIQFEVLYDSNVFDRPKASAGSIISDGIPKQVNNAGTGSFNVGMIFATDDNGDIVPVIKEGGILYTLTLTVKADAVLGSTELKFGDVSYSENNVSYVPAVLSGSTLSITNPCTGITLDKSSASVVRGETVQLTANVEPSDTTDKVEWSSNNTNIATVDKDGNVKGIAVGEATITAACGSQKANCTITVTKSKMTGTVTITGSAVFGETLTARYEEGNAENVSFSWYRGETKIADGSAYTVKQDDIGNKLRAVATSADYDGSVRSAETDTVEKATKEAPAAFEIKYEDNKIKVINPDTNAQYKLNDGEFGTTTEFDADYDTEYTVSARYPETATHKASAIVISNTVTTSKAPRGLTVAADGEGTVSGKPEGTLREGAEVTLTAAAKNFNHKFVKWEVSGITITDAEAADPKLTFTMPAGDVTVTAKFAEKDAVTCGFGTAEFTYDGNPHAPTYSPEEIANMTVSVKYLDSLNTELSGAPVAAGTYKIEVTFTPANANSDYCTTTVTQEFTIKKASQNKPEAPDVQTITATGFVLSSTVDSQEYAIKQDNNAPADGEWKDGAEVITTDLTPATTYYVFTRVKGNENHEPSPAAVREVKTLDVYGWEASENEVIKTVRVGGTLPEAMTVTLTNKSTCDLSNVTATLGDTNAGNFTLDAVSDTLAKGGEQKITVRQNGIDNTEEGTYTCTVTVTAAESVDDIVVTFTIKVVNKEVAKISGIADKTVTFNGANQTIDLSQAAVVCGDKKLDAKKLTVTYQKDGASAANTRDAGTYKVIITYEDADYVGSTNATLTITPKDVTVTGFAAASKEYDGNANASVTGSASLNGKIDGTDVSIATGDLGWRFEDKNVGTNKKVANSNAIKLTGADAANYNLTNPTVNLAAGITAKPVTITAAVKEKTYNGLTNDAKVTVAAAAGSIVADDDVKFENVNGTYANADAGEAVEVSVSYIVSGNDKDNYSFTAPAKVTGKVNKAELKVTLTAPAAVTYDGNAHGLDSANASDNRVAADNGKTLYVITYNGSDALPVDAGTYSVTAKPTDEGSKNYNMDANTVDLVINKADMTATDKEYSVAFMLAGAQTRPLSDLQLAPANVSGKWSVAAGTNEILDGASIDGENLVFTVKSGLTTADIGKKAELTLTFTPDKNYNPVNATVTVTLAQDTYTNSITPALPAQVKLGDALELSGVKLVTKFGSGAPDQMLDVTDTTKVEVTTTYDPAAKEIGVKTVTFTDKANSGITYTHSFTVVDVLDGTALTADETEFNYKLKEVSSIGFDGKVLAKYKSGATKALTHANVTLTFAEQGMTEARALNTLGAHKATLTYTETYFDGTTAAQSIGIVINVSASDAAMDGKPGSEGFALEPIPDEGKEMSYNNGSADVSASLVRGKLRGGQDAAKAALQEEEKKSGAFNNVGDNKVYENISFTDADGKSVSFKDGKMQATIPYPSDSSKDNDFVMIIRKADGSMETIVPVKTDGGLQFTIEGDVDFVLGWYTPAPAPVQPSEPEQDPQDSFWNEVYWALIRSGKGSVITANAGYFDKVPQGVLRAVDASGNTLIINSAFGIQVVVAPGALEKLGAYRFYYPISYLKEMLKGSIVSGSGSSTGVTIGVLMPTTGDATVVDHPYSMTPATAGIIPGLESVANARPVIENADGVSVLDGAQRNEGAVIGGGMLIGLGLLALLGAAYVTMRKRGN